MYSSGYSQVSRYSPPSQKKMQYRSKGKSCGYYMRIVFFFSSLIQSLIIVSLVLFLVYGKTQDSASSSRIQDLEESFSRLSIENVDLRQQRANLTNLLNTTLTEKAQNDFDHRKLRFVCNMSILYFQDYERKLQQCNNDLMGCRMRGYAAQCPQLTAQIPGNCNCGHLAEQMKAKIDLDKSNFTQTVQRMRMEMEQTNKERDTLSLETIHLRRDKSKCEKELSIYRQQSRNEFTQSLGSVSNVSRAFLEKIDTVFPALNRFMISCPKQSEHLEQIRNNCSSLSREIEDKLQRYLNIVGDQVSGIQSENSRLKAENWRLSEDYRWCSQNRTGMIVQHRQNLDKLQRKHDQDKERLLMEKMNLIGKVEVLENNVIFKSKEVDHLTESIKLLNISCMERVGMGGNPYAAAGLPPRPGTYNQPNSGTYGGGGGIGSLGRTNTGGLGTNYGSSASSYNKPSSTGIGAGSSSSSPGSSSSSSSYGSKPASSAGSYGSYGSSPSSTNLGSSGIGSKPYGSAGSSTSQSSSNSGSNKQTSSSYGSSSSSGSSGSYGSSSSSGSYGSSSSSGSSTSRGSSSSSGSSGSYGSSSSSGSSGSYGSSSSSGSTGSGSSYGSSGYGSNKQTSSSSSSGSSSGKTTSFFGSSSGSSSSTGSSSSSGSSSSAGTSRSSTGSSGSTGSTNKSGSTSGAFSFWPSSSSTSSGSKPASVPGKSTSSSGSGSYGGGRTSGLAGGTMSLTQHIQDIRRLLNPPGAGTEDKQDLAMLLG
ncbi:unnamed protein product [Ophioblennius macclurei]